MKLLRTFILMTLMAGVAGFTFISRADDQKSEKAKPYPLKTCLVCGMDLGMMGGKAEVFVYKGQEIKVCDKSEKADFEKHPDKFMKKLAEAAAKLKK